MKRSLLLIASIFYFLHSGAQETKPVRLNVTATFLTGLQFFSLDGIEAHTSERLERNMPFDGYYVEQKFKPTFWKHAAVAATVFKNKSIWLELNTSWGRNQITSYGYTTDSFGNPYKVSAYTDFNIMYSGWALKKEINFGKYGYIKPGLGFNLIWGSPYDIRVTYEAKNNVTGNILYNGRGVGGSADKYKFASPFLLALFDNPRVSIDYAVKITNHIYFNFSYSYWWANSYLNEFYSMSNYILNPRTSRLTTRKQTYHKDLYSHNLSVGLTFKLYK